MPALQIIQLRRGTAAEWTSADPVLAEAEAGYETDTGKMKFGDGYTAWALLPYFDTTPSGVVVMWNGYEADIPDGWHLCDGTYGTPDLYELLPLPCIMKL